MTDRSTQAYADRTVDHIARVVYHERAPACHRRRAWRADAAAATLQLLLALLVPDGSATADTPTPLRVEVSDSLDASAREVRAVLLDLEHFGRWFPALGAWRVLTRTVGSARVYGRQDLPWPVADRDYVVEYTWAETTDGAFVLDAIAQPEAMPAAPRGVVRIEHMHTRWTVRPTEHGTRVTYGYEGDPGGVLPAWVASLGWQARTDAVLEGLATELARRRRP